MGVWQKSGPSSYQLNHFALSFDTSSNSWVRADSQDVTLDKKADQPTPAFEDQSVRSFGNVIVEVVGNVTANRITVDTPIGDVL